MRLNTRSPITSTFKVPLLSLRNEFLVFPLNDCARSISCDVFSHGGRSTYGRNVLRQNENLLQDYGVHDEMNGTRHADRSLRMWR